MSKKSILITSLSIMLALCVTFGILATCGVFAFAEDGWSDVTWSNSEHYYEYYTTFDVPQRTVTVGGQQVNAQASVIKPDGSATSLSSFLLDQFGNYTICYTAKANNKVFSCEETITVRRKLISASSDKTTIEFAKGNYDDWQMIDHPKDCPDGKTLRLNIAQGDVVTFNKAIDMTELTVDQPLFYYFVDCKTRGSADADYVYFVLTDSVDSSVQVTMRVFRYMGHSGAWLTAGATGQMLKGFYQYTHDKDAEAAYFAANGVKKDILFPFGSDEYMRTGTTGTNVQTNFTSQLYDWNTNGLVDEATDRYYQGIFFDPGTNMIYTGYKYSPNRTPVTDLDDSTFYEVLFGGFPSGKAFLSVYASDYNSNTIAIHMPEVFGMGDFRETYDDYLEDTESPELVVDACQDDMFEGRIGGYYTIPTAHAHDTYCGATPVNVTVWYNDLVEVDVADGKFKTEMPGNYVIKYKAVDDCGNEVELSLTVHAGNESSSLAILIDQASATTVAEVGEYCTVPEATIVGGQGGVEVTAFATCGQKTLPITNGTFCPETVGEWTVTYKVVDATGQEKQSSYTVTINAGTQPKIVDSVEFPKYFLANQSNPIPLLYANDYTSGTLVRKLMNVKVTDASGTKDYLAGDYFVPEIANNLDTIHIVYSSTDCNNNSYDLLVKDVPVIATVDDNLDLLIENYFVKQNVTIDKTAGNKPGIRAVSQGVGTWEFAKEVAVDGLELVFSTLQGKGTFNSLSFTLTDAFDRDVALTLCIVRNGSTYCLADRDGNVVNDLSYDFNNGSRNFSLIYKNGQIRLGKLAIDYDTDDNGNEFVDFPSHKVLVSCKAVSSGELHLNLASLNGYVFSDAYMDLIAPKITLLDLYGGTYLKGETYTICEALASDVLDPYVQFTLTVTGPDGKVCVSKDNVQLKKVDPTRAYEIDLTQYGQYSVVYTANDSSRRSTLSYVVNVADSVPPVFNFEKGFKTTAKVGELYRLPNYTVTDDLSSADNIVVFGTVVNPQGIVLTLKNNSIVFQNEGVYTINLFASDEAGNPTFVSVKVSVTK